MQILWLHRDDGSVQQKDINFSKLSVEIVTKLPNLILIKPNFKLYATASNTVTVL